MNDNSIEKPDVVTITEAEKQETKSIVEKIIELIKAKHL